MFWVPGPSRAVAWTGLPAGPPARAGPLVRAQRAEHGRCPHRSPRARAARPGSSAGQGPLRPWTMSVAAAPRRAPRRPDGDEPVSALGQEPYRDANASDDQGQPRTAHDNHGPRRRPVTLMPHNNHLPVSGLCRSRVGLGICISAFQIRLRPLPEYEHDGDWRLAVSFRDRSRRMFDRALKGGRLGSTPLKGHVDTPKSKQAALKVSVTVEGGGSRGSGGGAAASNSLRQRESG